MAKENLIDNYKPIHAKIIHRLAAFLLDLILFVILLTGFLYLISAIFHYNSHLDNLHEEYRKIGYEIYNEETKEYEIISQDDPNIEIIMKEKNQNEIIIKEESFCNSFVLNSPLVAIFLSLGILEIIIPLILKNGQTIGMKCFHVGLLSNNKIAIKPIQTFIRGLFGKIIILTCIPYLGIFYIFYSSLYAHGGLLGSIFVLIVAITNSALLIFNKKHVGIQDILAQVYPVDASQVIFYRNEEELKVALLEEDKIRKSQKRIY